MLAAGHAVAQSSGGVVAGTTGELTAQTEGKLRVQVSTGYEQENFHWSIAGNSAGEDPNVYSELKWRNAGGFAAKVDLQWEVWKRWRVFASGNRTFTSRGSMTDTDYGLDNRNDQLYHQQFAVTGGYNEGGSAGIGYCLINRDRFRLTPFLGYGLSRQSFPITDPGGVYAQLNSTYAAKWFGPLVGFEASWRLGSRWQVVAKGIYDQVVYRATADWNLIQNFSHPVSFRHHADGFGVEGQLGLDYAIGRRWTFLVRADYFHWETGTGVDLLYLASGGMQLTQLNGVERDGVGGRIGAAWRF